jgi:hypothetical protein
MSGYNPNASMLPASNGGNIVAMSGGGVAEQQLNGGVAEQQLNGGVAEQQLNGGGVGLVFANGGATTRLSRLTRKRRAFEREKVKYAKALQNRTKRLQGIERTGILPSDLQKVLETASSGTSPLHLDPPPKQPIGSSGSTPAPVTPLESTPAPVTPLESTPAPVTPLESTPAPVTPLESTPAPVTPLESTPASVTPLESTPAPVTPPITITTTLPASVPEPTIDDVLKKLTESTTASKKEEYTPQEQDTILKNLATLLTSASTTFTIEVNKVKE